MRPKFFLKKRKTKSHKLRNNTHLVKFGLFPGGDNQNFASFPISHIHFTYPKSSRQQTFPIPDERTKIWRLIG